MINLETALSLVITKLIEPGHLDWPTSLAKLTINPARVLGLQKGTLQIGDDADVTIIDPRDRDTNADTTLDERLYGLQDANWNLTSIANPSATVQERYTYDAYGTSTAAITTPCSVKA